MYFLYNIYFAKKIELLKNSYCILFAAQEIFNVNVYTFVQLRIKRNIFIVSISLNFAEMNNTRENKK